MADRTVLPTFTAASFPSPLSSEARAIIDYGQLVGTLTIGIAFGLTDGAVLYTVPAGKKFHIVKAYWEITTSFTGGTASAIGISASDPDYNTPGDILGGAAGDLAATLVSTGRVYKGGAQGTKFGSNGIVVVGSGYDIKFNRIVSTFTAGQGYVHLDGFLINS